MASRKQLKQSIKYICRELLTDCIVLSKCNPEESEKYEALMVRILELLTDYVPRISHTERGSERLYYKRLIAEFTEKSNKISDDIIRA